MNFFGVYRYIDFGYGASPELDFDVSDIELVKSLYEKYSEKIREVKNTMSEEQELTDLCYMYMPIAIVVVKK